MDAISSRVETPLLVSLEPLVGFTLDGLLLLVLEPSVRFTLDGCFLLLVLLELLVNILIGTSASGGINLSGFPTIG